MRIMLILLTMYSLLGAMDVKLLGGPHLSGSNIDDNAIAGYGVEVAMYTAPRSNGINWGVAFGIVGADFKLINGGTTYLDLEMIYRVRHKFEGFLFGGPTFHSYNRRDYGYGWRYGVGSRYVFCNGFLFGVTFSRADLTYSSNQLSTEALDGQSSSLHDFLFMIGYRF